MTTGATKEYMAMAIRAIRGRFNLRLGHSAFAKYVANIRLDQYSFWPYDPQPVDSLTFSRTIELHTTL